MLFFTSSVYLWQDRLILLRICVYRLLLRISRYTMQHRSPFFAQPDGLPMRQYEALRAYLHEGYSIEDAKENLRLKNIFLAKQVSAYGGIPGQQVGRKGVSEGGPGSRKRRPSRSGGSIDGIALAQQKEMGLSISGTLNIPVSGRKMDAQRPRSIPGFLPEDRRISIV